MRWLFAATFGRFFIVTGIDLEWRPESDEACGQALNREIIGGNEADSWSPESPELPVDWGALVRPWKEVIIRQSAHGNAVPAPTLEYTYPAISRAPVNRLSLEAIQDLTGVNTYPCY